MITFPAAPILTDPTIQALLTLTIPKTPTLQTPAFAATVPTEPDNTVMTTLPFVYAAYGNLVQDEIDGRITTLAAYSLPSPEVTAQWKFEKEKILRKFDTARRESLRVEGTKNYVSMPGHIMRKLTEMSLNEKRELSDLTLKLLSENLTLSVEQVEQSLKAGIESDAIRFDSHHKIQSANFEAASFILKAGFDSVAADIDKYNENMTLIAAQLQQDKNETLRQIQELQAFESEIRAAGLQVEEDSLLMEAYKAGIDYVIAKAGMQLAQYQVYLVQAEVAKAEAEVGVAQARLSLAKMEAVTAQYEVYKSQAKITMAELDVYKQEVELAKTQLEAAQGLLEAAKSEASAIISYADDIMSANHTRQQAAKAAMEATETAARTEVDEEEANNIVALKDKISGNLPTLTGNIVNLAEARGASDETNTMTVEGAKRDHHSGVESAYTTLSSWHKLERQAAMKAAAEAAANATVTSEFHHYTGT